MKGLENEMKRKRWIAVALLAGLLAAGIAVRFARSSERGENPPPDAQTTASVDSGTDEPTATPDSQESDTRERGTDTAAEHPEQDGERFADVAGTNENPKMENAEIVGDVSVIEGVK